MFINQILFFGDGMAEEKDSNIFVLDNKLDLDYVDLLRQRNYIVEVTRSLSDEAKRKICRCNSPVFIFGYLFNRTASIIGGTGSSSGKIVDTGIDLAETIRLWEKGETSKKRYIHIVSSCAEQEKPPFGNLSWSDLVKNKIINSYSTRDIDSFKQYLKNIEDALRN